jgi:hypothetical protein
MSKFMSWFRTVILRRPTVVDKPAPVMEMTAKDAPYLTPTLTPNPAGFPIFDTPPNPGENKKP